MLPVVLPLLVIIICLIALSWFAGTDAPYVPTKMDLIGKVLKQAGVKKGRKFYELGSGDGRVVYLAARIGAEAVGIEQSLLRVLYSKRKAKQLNLPNAKFIHGNIFSHKYNNADIVYIYLLPQGINKLEEKLPKELKKGSVIITQTYHFPNIKHYQKIGDFKLYRI